MDLGGGSWGIITIVGPLLLVAVIVWAALRNRSSRASRDRTEDSTRRLYKEEDAAHRGEDDNVPLGGSNSLARSELAAESRRAHLARHRDDHDPGRQPRSEPKPG